MKRVGNENTVFSPVRDLTPAQYELYSNTDPLEVYEIDTEDGPRYRVRGCMYADDITAEELAALFD